MIVSQDEPPIVAAILQQIPLKLLKIPSLDVLLNNAPVPKIPFGKTFDEYRMAPFLLLHTSGSTGIPKIVTLRHGYTTAADANNTIEGGNELSDRVGNRRVFKSVPKLPYDGHYVVDSLRMLYGLHHHSPTPGTADCRNSSCSDEGWERRLRSATTFYHR